MPNPIINRRVLANATGIAMSAATTAWAARVVANGGAMPTAPTLAAVDTWYKALVAAGIDSLIINANFHAPDSDIASQTPFYVVSGNTLWTGYGAFHVSTAGVSCGNGAANPQSGVNPNVFTTGDSGLVAMGARAAALPQFVWGGGNGGSDCATLYGSNINGAAQVAGYSVWTLSPSSAGASNGDYVWFSAWRTATNLLSAYFANSKIGWLASGTTASASGTVPTGAGANAIGFNTAGNPAGISVATNISFLAVTHGMSSAQGQAFFNATQTLRQAFGGGFT